MYKIRKITFVPILLYILFYSTISYAKVKIIVIDKSESMASEVATEYGNEKLYKLAIEQAKREVEVNLKDNESQVYVIFFNNFVVPPVQIDSISEFEQLVINNPTSGNTNIGDTLMETYEIIRQRKHNSYFDLSIYTDGEETVPPVTSMETAIRKITSLFSNMEHPRVFFGLTHYKWGDKSNYKMDKLVRGMQEVLSEEDNIVFSAKERQPGQKDYKPIAQITLDPIDDIVISVDSNSSLQSQTIALSLQGKADSFATENQLPLSISGRMINSDRISLSLENTHIISSSSIDHSFTLELTGNNKRPLKLNKQYLVEVSISPTAILDEAFISPSALRFNVTFVEKPYFNVSTGGKSRLQKKLVMGEQYSINEYPYFELQWNDAAAQDIGKIKLDIENNDRISLLLNADATRVLTDEIPLSSALKSRVYVVSKSSGEKGDILSGTISLQFSQGNDAQIRTLDYEFETYKPTVNMVFEKPDSLRIETGDVTLPLPLRLVPDNYSKNSKAIIKFENQQGFTTRLYDKNKEIKSGQTINLGPGKMLDVRLFHSDPAYKISTFDPEQNPISITGQKPYVEVVTSTGKNTVSLPTLLEVKAFISCSPQQGFSLDSRQNIPTSPIHIECLWNQSFASQNGGKPLNVSAHFNDDPSLTVSIEKDLGNITGPGRKSFYAQLIPTKAEKLDGHLVVSGNTEDAVEARIPVSLNVSAGNFNVTNIEEKIDAFHFAQPRLLTKLEIRSENASANSQLILSSELLNANILQLTSEDGVEISPILNANNLPTTILVKANVPFGFQFENVENELYLDVKTNDPSMTINGESEVFFNLDALENLNKPQLDWLSHQNPIPGFLSVEVEESEHHKIEEVELTITNALNEEHLNKLSSSIQRFSFSPVILNYKPTNKIKIADVVFDATNSDEINLGNLLTQPKLLVRFESTVEKPLFFDNEERLKVYFESEDADIEPLKLKLVIESKFSLLLIFISIGLLASIIFVGIPKLIAMFKPYDFEEEKPFDPLGEENTENNESNVRKRRKKFDNEEAFDMFSED